MKINISIDDVTPHPRSSISVLDQCYDLIGHYPSIKFTLFVPLAYWRTIPSPPESVCPEPLRIDHYPDFCDVLRNLSRQNFELGFHGLHHGIPGKSNNDEFKSLSYSDAIEKFNNIFEIVKLANLQDIFKPIFRPPAWRMSPGAIQAAQDSGIEILALSPLDNTSKLYNGKNSPQESYKGFDKKFDRVVYSTSAPPFIPLVVEDKIEVVYHACEWDKNYLSKENTNELQQFLEAHRKNIKFCFLDDLARTK